jgi:PPOX class probable F420-dependent enzyme
MPAQPADGMTGLEQELQARLGTFIKRAEQALIAAKTAALAPHNLTVPQYSALLLLDYIPGASAAQLSRACLVTPQTMATVLENLQQKGLVTREPSAMHRRVLSVRLTQAGRAVVRAADRDARAVEARLLASFTEGEAGQLRQLLDRACDTLTADPAMPRQGADMPVIPPSHEDLLIRPLFAHLATIRPDGSPQCNPMWFAWDGARLRFTTTTTRRKHRNVTHHAQVAVSVSDPDQPYRYLEVRGDVVRIDPDPGAAFFAELATRYGFPANEPPGDAPDRVVLVVEPRSVSCQ